MNKRQNNMLFLIGTVLFIFYSAKVCCGVDRVGSSSWGAGAAAWRLFKSIVPKSSEKTPIRSMYYVPKRRRFYRGSQQQRNNQMRTEDVMDKIAERAKYTVTEPGKLPKPLSATERRLLGVDSTYNTAHSTRDLIVRGTKPENMYNTALRVDNKIQELNPMKPKPIYQRY